MIRGVLSRSTRFQFILVVSTLSLAARADDPSYYKKSATWHETVLASRAALRAETTSDEPHVYVSDLKRGGKAATRVKFDVRGMRDLWLTVTEGGDGYSHDMANWANARLIARDGTEVQLSTLKPDFHEQAWGSLRKNRNAAGTSLKIGRRTYASGLGTHATSTIHFTLKRDYKWFRADVGIDASKRRVGSARFVVSEVPDWPWVAAGLWATLERDFPESVHRREMRWEREDAIWETDEPSDDLSRLAERYARASFRRPELEKEALTRVESVKDLESLWGVRGLYLRSRNLDEAITELQSYDPSPLRLAIRDLSKSFPEQYTQGKPYLRRLAGLEDERKSFFEKSTKGLELDTKRIVTLRDDLAELKNEALLGNPLLDFDRLLLVRRNEDELGLPRNWQSNSCLPKSGFENEIAVLSPVRPEGRLTTLFRPERDVFVGDVDLDFDADKLLFSMPNEDGQWRVYELDADGTVLRSLPLIDDPDVGNYDACYMPDGNVMFTSTAPFIGVPCVGGSSHVATLYRLERKSGRIRQLGFDQDHDWCPTVLNNGRVLYQRWEYTDTPHTYTRLLFHMNPDGTEQMEYYGSNSYWPNAMFYARPVPNHPTKFVAVVGGHHSVPRMGELVLFDPAKGRHEADGVVQRIPGYGKKVEPIIIDRLPDPSWPKYLHPWPLSDKYFLVSAKPSPEALWGIYLVDVFDNRVLLKETGNDALLEPIPFRRTERPPVIQDKVDLERKDALVYLADVYKGEGLRGVPRGTVKQLRLFSYHFGYHNVGGLIGVLGMDGPWDVKRIMGTVPVEADGSAYFRVPANTPISVQPLDEEGKAVQLMRSWFTAMPGETLSCVGCHEDQNGAPANVSAVALQRPPSEVKPWHGPTRGFSFPREVQPVLDRYCVQCHDGRTRTEGNLLADLRGDRMIDDYVKAQSPKYGGQFSVAYAELCRFVRRPGIENDYHRQKPMEFHVDTTQLIQMLQKGHHGVELDTQAWDRLITWIDLNAPYHGTWHELGVDLGDQIERRREMLRRYAGFDENPEAIPAVTRKIADTPDRSTASLGEGPGSRFSPLCTDWPFDSSEAAARQRAAGNPSERTVDLGDGVTLRLTLVPPGEFLMGDVNGANDERPLTRVNIDSAYWMGTFEITNEQYARYDSSHDSGVEHKITYQFDDRGYSLTDAKTPAVRVSWKGAAAFCAWLSERTGERFRLPTEAEWEYACRAGTSTPMSYGDLDRDFSPFANLSDAQLSASARIAFPTDLVHPNPSRYDDWIPKDARFDDGALVTTDVGRYAPNPWGLHDMHGNAGEWTCTTYRAYPYRSDDGRDSGDDRGKKVVRGGSWRDRPVRCRSAFRTAYLPHQQVYNVGFRVMCEVNPGKVASSKTD